jgi:hypothetical protein
VLTLIKAKCARLDVMKRKCLLKKIRAMNIQLALEISYLWWSTAKLRWSISDLIKLPTHDTESIASATNMSALKVSIWNAQNTKVNALITQSSTLFTKLITRTNQLSTLTIQMGGTMSNCLLSENTTDTTGFWSRVVSRPAYVRSLIQTLIIRKKMNQTKAKLSKLRSEVNDLARAFSVDNFQLMRMNLNMWGPVSDLSRLTTQMSTHNEKSRALVAQMIALITQWNSQNTELNDSRTQSSTLVTQLTSLTTQLNKLINQLSTLSTQMKVTKDTSATRKKWLNWRLM